MAASLEDLLLQHGLISSVQLAVAKRDADVRHKRLAPTIIDLGLIDEVRFARWISQVTGISLVDPLPDDAVFALERRVPRGIATELQVVPIGLDGDRLTIAMLDPTEQTTLEVLRRTTGLDIQPAVGRYGELMRLVTRFYPEDDAEPTILPGQLPIAAETETEAAPFEVGSQTLINSHARPFILGDESPGSATHIFTPRPDVESDSGASQMERIERRLESLERALQSIDRKLDAIAASISSVLPRG